MTNVSEPSCWYREPVLGYVIAHSCATSWAEPLVDTYADEHDWSGGFTAKHEDNDVQIVGVLPAPADTWKVSARLVWANGRRETRELGFEYGVRRPDAYWDARVAEALTTQRHLSADAARTKRLAARWGS